MSSSIWHSGRLTEVSIFYQPGPAEAGREHWA